MRNNMSMIDLQRRYVSSVNNNNGMLPISPQNNPFQESLSYAPNSYHNFSGLPMNRSVSNQYATTGRRSISSQLKSAAATSAPPNVYYWPTAHHQSQRNARQIKYVYENEFSYPSSQFVANNNRAYHSNSLRTQLTASQYMHMLHRYNNSVNYEQQQQAQLYYYSNQQSQPASNMTYPEISYYYSNADSIFNNYPTQSEVNGGIADSYSISSQQLTYPHANKPAPTGYEAVRIDSVTRDSILKDFRKEAQYRKRKLKESFATPSIHNKNTSFTVSENSAFVPTNQEVQQPVLKQLKHYDENNNECYVFPEAVQNLPKNSQTESFQHGCQIDNEEQSNERCPGVVDVDNAAFTQEKSLPNKSMGMLSQLIKSSIEI